MTTTCHSVNRRRLSYSAQRKLIHQLKRQYYLSKKYVFSST